MIYNLLANAIKFSDAETGQVWLRLTAQEEWVILDVEDNGIGIPSEHLNRIFDRFTQVEGVLPGVMKGVGLAWRW